MNGTVSGTKWRELDRITRTMNRSSATRKDSRRKPKDKTYAELITLLSQSIRNDRVNEVENQILFADFLIL